jgi:hypothetical protein
VEKPATAQEKEETAHSLRAREIGALATLRNFARTVRKDGGTPELALHFIREALVMGPLKEGAIGE